MCSMVSEQEIIQELEKGAISTEEIQSATTGGTTCGRCLMEIDAIVEAHLKNKN